jgi:hypothetical protein
MSRGHRATCASPSCGTTQLVLPTEIVCAAIGLKAQQCARQGDDAQGMRSFNWEMRVFAGSRARAPPQSGGLGVWSSNLPAPTNNINHLCPSRVPLELPSGTPAEQFSDVISRGRLQEIATALVVSHPVALVSARGALDGTTCFGSKGSGVRISPLRPLLSIT